MNKFDACYGGGARRSTSNSHIVSKGGDRALQITCKECSREFVTLKWKVGRNGYPEATVPQHKAAA